MKTENHREVNENIFHFLLLSMTWKMFFTCDGCSTILLAYLLRQMMRAMTLKRTIIEIPQTLATDMATA